MRSQQKINCFFEDDLQLRHVFIPLFVLPFTFYFNKIQRNGSWHIYARSPLYAWDKWTVYTVLFCLSHGYLNYCFMSTLFGFVLHIFRRHFGADISFVANLPRQRLHCLQKVWNVTISDTVCLISDHFGQFSNKNLGHCVETWLKQIYAHKTQTRLKQRLGKTGSFQLALQLRW